MKFQVSSFKFQVLAALLLACFLSAAFAQTILTAPGLAAFKKKSTGGGGGGCSPSYANNGGTGNRTSIITITPSSSPFNPLNGAGSTLVDGDTTSNGRNFFNSLTLDSSIFITFDFGSAVTITEAKYYQQTSTSQGVWQWRGSNDGSTWTSIGGTFSLVTANTTTLTTLSGNATAYRYYQLLGVSGSTSNGPWIYQFEFKICGL